MDQQQQQQQPSLNIAIDDNRRKFSPCETLAGRVTWTVGVDPKSAELRLFWYTSGKGTQNVGIVQAIPFGSPQRSDRREFRLVLPQEPYSCSGSLISIIWALELIVEPHARTERVEFTMGPNGNEVILAKTSA
jgi:hypothetical protein